MADATDTCPSGHPRTPLNVHVRPDGNRICRPCRRAIQKKYRSDAAVRARVTAQTAASKLRHSERVYARNRVYAAVKSGVLARPDACERCEIKPDYPVEASHDDYSRPLDVEWLCKLCHAEKDKKAAMDDKHQHAIDTVAKRLVLVAVERALDLEDIGWEDFPDLGQDDWQAVERRARLVAKVHAPGDDYYAGAYEHLAARAEGVEA